MYAIMASWGDDVSVIVVVANIFTIRFPMAKEVFSLIKPVGSRSRNVQASAESYSAYEIAHDTYSVFLPTVQYAPRASL